MQNLERKGFRFCSPYLYYVAIIRSYILSVRGKKCQGLTGCLRAPGWQEMGATFVNAVAGSDGISSRNGQGSVQRS